MRSAILMLFLVGCQFNPFASELTKVRPDEKQLVGRYTPDAETRQRLASALNVQLSPTCELLLREDRTFIARDFPNCWSPGAIDCGPGTLTFSGHWSVRQIDGRSYVQVGSQLANLRGDAPPYIVHFTIGDPDSGNALALARSGSPGTDSAPSRR